MNCKQIGQYALICNNTDWYFDNDDNGMSYFIYKPTETKYSMVVAPQNCCCGCEAEPQIKFGVNAQVIQSTTDEKEAQEWLNNLVNNNFMGMIAVPTYIKQYEAVRKYLNARESSRFTESDLHYLEENMYKAYHITEQSFKNYVDYYTEHFEEKEEFANVDRFVEGFVNTAAQVLAGKNGKTGFAATGILAMLPMITKFIPIPGLAQVVQGGLFVAKVLAGAKMAQSSEKYLKAKDKKEKALIISTAVASQVLQCFAAWKGSKLLQGAVNKISNWIGTAFAKKPTQVESTGDAAAQLAAKNGVEDQGALDKIRDPATSPEEAAKIAKEAGASDEVVQNITKGKQQQVEALKTAQADAQAAQTQAEQAETQNAAEIQQANQVAQQPQQAQAANQQAQAPAAQQPAQRTAQAAPAQTPAPQAAPQQTAQVATNTQQQSAQQPATNQQPAQAQVTTAQPAQQSTVMAFRNGKPISQLSAAEKEQMQAEAAALTGNSQQAQAVPMQGTANQLQATPITDDPERQARLDAIRGHNADLQAQAQPTLSNRDMRKMMRQNAKAVKKATA